MKKLRCAQLVILTLLTTQPVLLAHPDSVRAIIQQDDPPRISAAESERIIANRSRQVLAALKTGNMTRFATFVHPQKGVRFSAYAQILPDQDRVLRRNELAQMWTSSRRYNWGGGGYDGSGDPIRLTFRGYHRRFIFDHDYTHAKNIAYNPDNLSRGNTPNNIKAIYPDSIAVEYHFSGFEKKFDGMDWKSLWLVFEKARGQWYLVGIVHDEWTI